VSRISIDPGSLTSAAGSISKVAGEMDALAKALIGRPLPEMPPHVLARTRDDLVGCSGFLRILSDGLRRHFAAQLAQRARLAIIAGSGEVFGGLMSMLLPALRWLYGGKEAKKDELGPGGMFGGSHDIWKRRHMDNRQWSDSWWKGKGARNMPWEKKTDREWLDAGVKLWSKEVGTEANVWDSVGKYHNVAVLGASAKGGASLKFGKDGLEAGLDGSAAAYLLRGDVGFDKKYAEANAGVFVGGLAEAKATLKMTRGQLNAEAGGKVFVGGEAHASGALKGMGVKAGGNASVSYGLGAEAKGEAAIGLNKIKLKGKIGLTFGIGGSVGVDLEWSPKDTLKDAGDLLKKIPKPKLKPPWDW